MLIFYEKGKLKTIVVLLFLTRNIEKPQSVDFPKLWKINTPSFFVIVFKRKMQHSYDFFNVFHGADASDDPSDKKI